MLHRGVKTMQIIDYVFSYISDERLQQLSKKISVDKKNTKITGALIVKGLIILILSGQKISLRMLSMLIDAHLGIETTYSGLSKRLKTLNVDYFKTLYEELSQSCIQKLIPSDQQILYRFDSTVITLSGRILQDGIDFGGGDNDNHIKITLGLKNELPASIRFCVDKSEGSEDVALVKAINEGKVKNEDILLFDRGIQRTQSYEDFSQKGYRFVTRLKLDRKCKKIRTNQVISDGLDGNNYIEDIVVNLYKGFKKGEPNPIVKNEVRIIKFINSGNNEIWIATNIFDLSTQEIANLYKRRWDIEVFFKFIKQNLGYKHFLSHNLNGMKVYIYMILITALLFLLYKKTTKLTGFKLPLLSFKLKMEKSFIKDLIIISGGDPELVKDYL